MWRPGEAVLWQNVTRGVVNGAVPMTVVADGDDLVTWLAPGTRVVWPRPGHSGQWQGNGVLAVTPAERRHSIWLFQDSDGSFPSWYVHLLAPIKRGHDRFQTTDWHLDLIVRQDGEVVWKDEDELAQAVELGTRTAEEAETAYAEAHRVLDEWPFPTGWEEFQPDPTWPTPALPRDWSDHGLP